MREVRLTAAGHPDVTGRHDKTLELTAQDAITARATCILGVTAGPLPGGLPLLRGPVALTLTAGDCTATVRGEVNPAYSSDSRLVVRRSGQRDPDTFLVHADRAAVDLPRQLIDALAAGAELTVTAAETRTPDRVVLVVTGGPAAAEIERLAAQADLVVDLTPRGAPPPPVPIVAPRVHKMPADVDVRTVLVLARDPADALPLTTGVRVVLWPPVAGADLLLSAGLPPYPLLQTGPRAAKPAGARPGRPAGFRVGKPAGPGAGAPVAPAPGAPVVLAERPAEIPAGWTAVTDGGEVGWGVRAAADSGSGVHTGGASGREVRSGRDPGQGDGGGDAGQGDRGGDSGRKVRGGGESGTTVLIPPPTDALTVDPAELARLLRRSVSGRDAAAVLGALGLPRRDAYRLAADPGGDAR